MCSGTEILYANAQLLSRFTLTKYAVYTTHDRSGIARWFRNRARGPAEGDRKLGMVKRAQITNWANVIKGPMRGTGLVRICDGVISVGSGCRAYRQ